MLKNTENSRKKKTKIVNKHILIHSQVSTRLFTFVHQFSLNKCLFKQISLRLVKFECEIIKVNQNACYVFV